MRRGGFTLVEVVVALGLLTVISASVLRVLQLNQQMYRDQVERMQINATLRAAASILPGELRELAPADPRGGDLIRMTPSTITYRAVRNLYVVCRAPSRGQSTITLFRDFIGSRPINTVVDSVLVFVEGNPTTGADDAWLHADPVWVRSGVCPGGAAGISVGLEGVSPVDLETVAVGAPVRTGAVIEMLRYRDRNGAWWLGMRRLRKSGRRPSVQPLLGPLAPGGLEFSYYDADGAPTSIASKVAGIGVIITARGLRSRQNSHSAASIAQRRIAIRVTLRNAPRG